MNQTDTLVSVTQTISANNWLEIVAMLEADAIIVLLIVLLSLKKKLKADKLYSSAKTKSAYSANSDIDLDNTIISSFKAGDLYKKLLIKCHPDRFANDALLQNKAEEFTLLLAANKHNYKKLVELKEQIEKSLYKTTQIN